MPQTARWAWNLPSLPVTVRTTAMAVSMPLFGSLAGRPGRAAGRRLSGQGQPRFDTVTAFHCWLSPRPSPPACAVVRTESWPRLGLYNEGVVNGRTTHSPRLFLHGFPTHYHEREVRGLGVWRGGGVARGGGREQARAG